VNEDLDLDTHWVCHNRCNGSLGALVGLQEEWMMRERDIGCVIFVLSAFAGFMFPSVAKWILLVLALGGLGSWWGQEKAEEE